MTEEHILSFKPAAGLDQIGNEGCERVQDRKHRYQRCADSALLRESGPDIIFRRDRHRRTFRQPIPDTIGTGGGLPRYRRTELSDNAPWPSEESIQVMSVIA